jgi:hypothetical protein
MKSLIGISRIFSITGPAASVPAAWIAEPLLVGEHPGHVVQDADFYHAVRDRGGSGPPRTERRGHRQDSGAGKQDSTLHDCFPNFVWRPFL